MATEAVFETASSFAVDNNNNNEKEKAKQESSWWPSFRWVVASKEQCLKAERNLINQYANTGNLNCVPHDVLIDFDAIPKSLRKTKQSSHSKSMSTFSVFSFWNTNTTDEDNKQDAEPLTLTTNNNNNHHQLSKSETHLLSSDLCRNLKVNDNSNDNNVVSSKIGSSCCSNATNKKQESIHTVTVTPNFTNNNNGSSQLQMQDSDEKEKVWLDSIPPIVLNHGYGCAGGIFLPGMEILGERLMSHIKFQNQTQDNSSNKDFQPLQIHVIDWLGCGLSSKPKFECTNVEESEDFFVESLEAWRKKMNLNKFILAGHSLGGYMSCVYAFRYPQYIDHLILISPVGIPKKPPSFDNLIKQWRWGTTFAYLWEKNFTPHDMIRYTGPKGPSLVKKLIHRRLALDDSDPLSDLLSDYLYNTLFDNGSGEYALNKVLEPGAWARKPLYERISFLKQFQNKVVGYENDHSHYKVNTDKTDDSKRNSKIAEKEKARMERQRKLFQTENEESSGSDIDASEVLQEMKDETLFINSNLKIDFIYGEHDWMNPTHAFKIKRKNKIKCDVCVIPDVGHQLILENPKEFAKTIATVIIRGQTSNLYSIQS